MIRSMTGFGQAGRSVGGIKIQVDLKSVNHRYCEIMIRMPREWLSCEDALKKTIQQAIHRGRVDVFVTLERDAASRDSVSIDWSLAEAYHQAAKQLKERFALSDTLSLKDFMLIPELISFRENSAEPDEVIGEQLTQCVKEALNHLLLMREAEGKHLYSDMMSRLQVLANLHSEMAKAAPMVIIEYRNKLRNRIQEMLSDTANFDENRFAMEVALMADRSNIDEELTRLQSHFGQFGNLLGIGELVGRKLDFLIQEMNREVNTIGSKANHSDLVNKVVDMKAELEKIREQVQNIE